jgi:hypothetical protein
MSHNANLVARWTSENGPNLAKLSDLQSQWAGSGSLQVPC